MTNNPNGTSPEQPNEPTIVDNSREAVRTESVEVETEVVPKSQYDEIRSLNDRRYAAQLDNFANLAKANPQLLKEMDGSNEEARKFRDSVTKRVYPQYSSYEQALDYINGVEDPKVQIDARLEGEDIRLNAYLDALSEFNADYQLDSSRTKFKDEFRSFVTTLPYEERLQKTKRALGIVSQSQASTTPVSGGTPPVSTPVKTEAEIQAEKLAEYNKVKHLIG